MNVAQGQINQDVSADEGLCGRNILIYLTLCYVHCSTSSLFAISHVAMSLYSIIRIMMSPSNMSTTLQVQAAFGCGG